MRANGDPWLGRYRGILINTGDGRRGYGFINITTIEPLDGPLPQDLPMEGDLLLHIKYNSSIGKPMPVVPTPVVFRMRPTGDPHPHRKIKVYGAHLDYEDDSQVPRYRGCITTPSGVIGYGFIGRHTIEHVSGPELDLPQQDLLIHINENRALPSPIPRGSWIIFFARFDTSKKKIRVYGAELEQP